MLLVIFQVESPVLAPGWPQTTILLSINSHVAGIIEMYHHAQLSYWDGVSLIFLPLLASNCEPPYPYLLSNWHYRCESPRPTKSLYFLKKSMGTFKTNNTNKTSGKSCQVVS
jgi:hypothetical protein